MKAKGIRAPVISRIAWGERRGTEEATGKRAHIK